MRAVKGFLGPRSATPQGHDPQGGSGSPCSGSAGSGRSPTGGGGSGCSRLPGCCVCRCFPRFTAMRPRGTTAKADPAEVERAKRVAAAAQKAGIQHLVYNSSGGADRDSGIPHIEQKYAVEQVFREAGLPTTMIRSCLFMEEFWKKYTRPSILNGKFRFSVQADRPLHLVSTKRCGTSGGSHHATEGTVCWPSH